MKMAGSVSGYSLWRVLVPVLYKTNTSMKQEWSQGPHEDEQTDRLEFEDDKV